MTTDGFPLVGDSGPITLQPTDREISISKDGTISVRAGTSIIDSVRGKLRLVKFENPQALRKQGASTFAAPDGVQPVPVTEKEAHVVQGAVEKSNVRPVVEMSRMIEVTRAYTEIATMLQQQNDLRKNSLQQLSEVPA
jgi:flagellar hook-basal body protein